MKLCQGRPSWRRRLGFRPGAGSRAPTPGRQHELGQQREQRNRRPRTRKPKHMQRAGPSHHRARSNHDLSATLSSSNWTSTEPDRRGSVRAAQAQQRRVDQAFGALRGHPVRLLRCSRDRDAVEHRQQECRIVRGQAVFRERGDEQPQEDLLGAGPVSSVDRAHLGLGARPSGEGDPDDPVGQVVTLDTGDLTTEDPKSLPLGVHRLEPCCHTPTEPLVDLGHRRDDQSVLRREVMLDRADGDTGLARDRADGQRIGTARRHDPQQCIEDPIPVRVLLGHRLRFRHRPLDRVRSSHDQYERIAAITADLPTHRRTRRGPRTRDPRHARHEHLGVLAPLGSARDALGPGDAGDRPRGGHDPARPHGAHAG
ncbi:hypothetical protein PLANTIT3_50373 [Plantibacter sp. T3]|nr:hypothetical protein PLANTIT3_50373 [Plantibacter sp. T3]